MGRIGKNATYKISLFFDFTEIFHSKTKIKCFKSVQILWKIRNRLNKKNISDCYFSSYWQFCTQNDPNYRWVFTHNSKNINCKKNIFCFSFYSAHCASFMKIWLFHHLMRFRIYSGFPIQCRLNPAVDLRWPARLCTTTFPLLSPSWTAVKVSWKNNARNLITERMPRGVAASCSVYWQTK